MAARKPKTWLTNGGTSTNTPAQPATGLGEHREALASLADQTKRLRGLDKICAELAQLQEQTAQTIEAVSDKLLESPKADELNAEWDRLEAARKKLGDQSAVAEKKLFSVAEALQTKLKLDIPAANRLLSAWRECIAFRAAKKIMEHVDPSKAAEAEPLCCKLALLNRDYVGARERIAVPSESYAWTASLRPMPSQKLDTGLIADPLFKPPDVRALIKAILGCAEQLVRHWGALLKEIEGSGEGFVAPVFAEEARPNETHPEWANPTGQSESDYIRERARESGRDPSALSERELEILRRSYQDHRSGIRATLPVSDTVPLAAPVDACLSAKT
jgi:hypothetical protein